MLNFVNDYSEGAHEAVLKRLIETNREALPGYGMDPYCKSAGQKIFMQPVDEKQRQQKNRYRQHINGIHRTQTVFIISDKRCADIPEQRVMMLEKISIRHLSLSN